MACGGVLAFRLPSMSVRAVDMGSSYGQGEKLESINAEAQVAGIPPETTLAMVMNGARKSRQGERHCCRWVAHNRCGDALPSFRRAQISSR